MQSPQTRESTGTLEHPPAPETYPGRPGRARYVTVEHTARVLDVSRAYVYRLVHAGIFPGRKAGRKIDVLAVFLADLLDAISAGRTVDYEAFGTAWQAARTVTP